MARITASTIVLPVIGALKGIAMVCVAFGFAKVCTGPPMVALNTPPPGPEATAEAALARVRRLDGGRQLGRRGGRQQRAAQTEGNTERGACDACMAIVSPMTWAVILPRAPSGCRTRTRRETAAKVSRLATANAAKSANMASHLPRVFASCVVVFSDPVTPFARLAELVTAADGLSREISLVTVPTSAALAAAT